MTTIFHAIDYHHSIVDFPSVTEALGAIDGDTNRQEEPTDKKRRIAAKSSKKTSKY